MSFDFFSDMIYKNNQLLNTCSRLNYKKERYGWKHTINDREHIILKEIDLWNVNRITEGIIHIKNKLTDI